jgi:hypothetical protein
MSKKRPSNSILNYLEFKRVRTNRTPTPDADRAVDLPADIIVSERSVEVDPLPLVVDIIGLK